MKKTILFALLGLVVITGPQGYCLPAPKDNLTKEKERYCEQYATYIDDSLRAFVKAGISNVRDNNDTRETNRLLQQQKKKKKIQNYLQVLSLKHCSNDVDLNPRKYEESAIQCIRAIGTTPYAEDGTVCKEQFWEPNHWEEENTSK